MTMNAGLIEQIVQGVLAELSPATSPVRAAPTPPASVSSQPVAPQPAKPEVAVVSAAKVLDAVITADLLDGKARGAKRIEIGQKSLLTPSARDWLRTKQVQWLRQSKSSSGPSAGAIWRLLIQTSTPVVQGVKTWLIDQSPNWQAELAGTVPEAVKSAVTQLATAEVNGVAIVSDAADVACCLLNRHASVRAAVVGTRAEWTSIRTRLGPNAVCVPPGKLSLMELRNLLKDIGSQPSVKPANWPE
ncbi:MAG: hypothetical protein KF777_18835 [Planctomycetaceae bacterium]|nr:hypothetical protein [Planctomycetaceae bacterium]